MEFLYDYGLFAVKLITLALSIVAVVAMLAAVRDKQSGAGAKGFLEIIRLNEQYDEMRESVMLATLNEAEQKVQAKALDEARKGKHKADKKAAKKNATPINLRWHNNITMKIINQTTNPCTNTSNISRRSFCCSISEISSV